MRGRGFIGKLFSYKNISGELISSARERIQFMHKGFKALLFSLTAASVFSGTAVAAGWTVNERGQQVYQNDNGSVATNTWIKMNQNGRTEWYYATANGSLKQDGWQKIGDSYYYFDGNGMMQTGWVQDDKYYCDPSSGRMVTGWKLLPLPEGVSAAEGRKSINNNYWFYFNESTGEKLYARDERVVIKTIGNASYGFDENGIMVIGWAQTADGNPEIAGYSFFADKTEGKLKLGQRITESWYATVGPEGDNASLSTGNVEWFYFKNNGHPAAGNGSVYEVQRIGDKRYLFNEKGNPVYGIQKGKTSSNAAEAFYYCGKNKDDSSVKTGKMNLVDGEGEVITCYFENSGKGVTGVKQDYVYYNGRLQKAEKGTHYQKITLPGQNRSYVINESGRIMKSRTKYRDADGSKWSVNASGVITLDEGLDTVELLSPAVTDIS